jgi:hypothetical protein
MRIVLQNILIPPDSYGSWFQSACMVFKILQYFIRGARSSREREREREREKRDSRGWGVMGMLMKGFPKKGTRVGGDCLARKRRGLMWKISAVRGRTKCSRLLMRPGWEWEGDGGKEGVSGYPGTTLEGGSAARWGSVSLRSPSIDVRDRFWIWIEWKETGTKGTPGHQRS